MESLIKPFGAFIEYTLLPLVDRSRELIDLIESRGLKLKSMLKTATILFIIDKVFSLITTLSVTYLICKTAVLLSQVTNL